MHASKVSCRKWAVTMYYVLTARKGISSMQLSKELGVTQKTAWFMLARVREGCRRGDYQLAGEVEVDEVYIGGREGNKHARARLHAGRGAGILARQTNDKSSLGRHFGKRPSARCQPPHRHTPRAPTPPKLRHHHRYQRRK